MRYISILFVLPMLLPTTRVVGQSMQDVPMFQFVSEQYERAGHASMNYTSRMAHTNNARAIEQARQQLLTQLRSSLRALENLKPTERQQALQQNAINDIRIWLLRFDEQWERTAELRALSESSYDALEAYYAELNQIEELQDSASQRMSRTSSAFAASAGITLIEDKSKFAKVARRAGEVNRQVRAVKLALFRSLYMGGLLSAQITQKLPGEEVLSTAAQLREANVAMLADLRKIKALSFDDNYRSAALNFGMFVSNLGTNQCKRQAELYAAGISNNAQVDEYNRIVNYLNKEYNQQVQKLNDAQENFLERNIPRRVPKP